jgi:hypothetical protein
MSRASKVLSGVAVLVGVLLGSATPVLWSQESGGNVVIVFKDGHRQSFRLADIVRIEFEHTALTASAGRSRFGGRWTVGVGGGSSGFFDIILNTDGTAHKTIGDGGDGTWAVVNGDARITWQDGWRDVIHKEGHDFKKLAFSAGRSLDGEPDSVASAEYHEPQ